MSSGSQVEVLPLAGLPLAVVSGQVSLQLDQRAEPSVAQPAEVALQSVFPLRALTLEETCGAPCQKTCRFGLGDEAEVSSSATG